MPHAFSYVRFSTAEQSKGDSLRRQTAAAEAWAAANLELDQRLTDAGLSAYHGAHRSKGALGTFLAAVEAGAIERGSVLIVESLDRLSRSTVLNAMEQLSSLIHAGVEVVTLADGQRYSRETIEADWTRLMLSMVIMARANEESARKSERIRAAWAQKKKTASERALTKSCVGWCAVENGQYVPIPEHAETVQRIFDMCAAGVGLDSIAKRLNQDGTAHFGRSKVGWYPSYIKKILENEAVLGFYQPGKSVAGARTTDGDPIPDVYPAVISRELFYAARAATALRRSRKPGRAANGYSNLLTGLARCSCGKPMRFVDKTSIRGGKRYPNRYLVCDGLRRGLGCDGDAGWWQYPRAEAIVLERVRHVDFAALTNAESAVAAEARANADGLAATLDKAQARQRKLVSEFGDDADDVLAAEIRAAGAKVRQLKQELAAAKKASDELGAATAPGGRAEIIERLRRDFESPNEQTRLLARAGVIQELRRAVDHAVFSRDEIVVHYKTPDGVRGRFKQMTYAPAALVHQLPPPPVEPPHPGDEDLRTMSRRRAKAASVDNGDK